jgi:hypothetical protein
MCVVPSKNGSFKQHFLKILRYVPFKKIYFFNEWSFIGYQITKGLFGRAPAPPKTAPALAPLVEWLL